MGKCKIRQFESVDGNIIPVDYTCSDVYNLKKSFCEQNKVDEIIKNGKKCMAYEKYCEQLDRVIVTCTCNPISMKCEKCPEEDHVGYFCGCENRNIALAKQLRKDGKSSWIKNESQQK